MKYPSIGSQALRTLNIPELSGGLNMRDGISAVNDNQLTECKNVWFKGGLLKTRPGTVKEALLENDGFLPTCPYGEMFSNNLRTENARTEGMRILSQKTDYYQRAETGSPTYPAQSHIQFFGVGLKGDGKVYTKRLPGITSDEYAVFYNYFVIQNKSLLYCFAETQSGGDIYRLKENGDNWEKLGAEDMYVPIIMTSCKPTGGFTVTKQDLTDGGAVMLEGYNLLGGYCRSVWSTYNGSAAMEDSQGKKYHIMVYRLIGTCFDFPGKTITAVITDKNGREYRHSVTMTSERKIHVEEASPGDGRYMCVGNDKLWFSVSNDDSKYSMVYEEEYVENNLVITEPCRCDTEMLKKVFGMTRQIWYGGDAAGIFGGSRIFLGGNTDAEEKSLLIWSGLNNPLYFSENCYTYVGDINQAITAFGRQSDMLVIFKERETFLTEYVKNEISASELINQSVVDYGAASVYFPMIQLHAGIGCDCPDSVQLCRNRLVWSCSDGNVYTLCNDNQYSERTIFKVSDMIGRGLSEVGLYGALSADADGGYYIFKKNCVYVMEYESYGYVYVASYSKSEDAQMRIPWWLWELSDDIVCAFTQGAGLYILTEKEGDNYMPDYELLRFDAGCAEDADGKPIKTALQTKIFDFGTSAYAKSVPTVNISFGNNGGAPIEATFVTNKGVCGTEEVIISENDENEYSPGFVHNRELRPCADGVTRFGVRFECEGIMSIDAISLNYRILGGARN